ncbi:DUF456 domain-containing protein [Saccharicrinis sp. FJH62]|uniref:DUF456 domain-containing protein n=1 Tax=Saccharicrinis sp. FJH62 TaxID=3344657 RepID=UPI0035D4C6AE
MDILLSSLGVILILIGLAGCILPGIPGPPISFVGLLVLHFTKYVQINENTLITWGIIAVIVTVLDNFVPIWGTKKFGGSKWGVWGSIIGLLIGMFVFPPFGIIIGPFAGAVIGEMMAGQESHKALKAGFGAFVGFLFGTGVKLVASGWMTWIFFREMFHGIN